MIDDPIVREVREAGQRLFEESGGTLESICEMLRREEAKETRTRPVFRRQQHSAKSKNSA